MANMHITFFMRGDENSGYNVVMPGDYRAIIILNELARLGYDHSISTTDQTTFGEVNRVHSRSGFRFNLNSNSE
jgi:hypothetical protein